MIEGNDHQAQALEVWPLHLKYSLKTEVRNWYRYRSQICNCKKAAIGSKGEWKLSTLFKL